MQVREIEGWGEEGQGYVILIRIPQSVASPHVVAFKGGSRFYSRHSAGKYPLDVDELRSAFLATDSQAERIKNFRLDRLGAIIADETPVLLSTPHRLAIHIIPITSFLNNSRLDLSNSHSLITLFPPIASGGRNHRFNLDGFVTHSTAREDGERNHDYCQLYFNGVVESLDVDVPVVMKPIFDSVWNACGYARSFNYDESGNWSPRR